MKRQMLEAVQYRKFQSGLSNSLTHSFSSLGIYGTQLKMLQKVPK